jgi:hypothetical protein
MAKQQKLGQEEIIHCYVLNPMTETSVAELESN